MVHSGYFEKNNSGLKGEASYLAIKDRETFDKAFGVAFTMGKKPNVLPANAFDTRIVVAAVKRGGQVWEYKVEGVTTDHATLTVRYGAPSKDGSGVRFASPMVVSCCEEWSRRQNVIQHVSGPGNALGKFYVVSADSHYFMD